MKETLNRRSRLNSNRAGYSMDEEQLFLEDLQDIKEKKFNISCCRSYLTTRGRCYSCPDQDLSEQDDE